MNSNYKRRDEIIFGEYDDSRYKLGGCAHADIDYETLKTLVDEDFIDMDENQNWSPSTKDFLDMSDGFKDNVSFEIYAISPQREDYRVTIEGINVEVPETDIDSFIYFIQNLRSADEFNIYNNNDKFYIHAWWD